MIRVLFIRPIPISKDRPGWRRQRLDADSLYISAKEVSFAYSNYTIQCEAFIPGSFV